MKKSRNSLQSKSRYYLILIPWRSCANFFQGWKTKVADAQFFSQARKRARDAELFTLCAQQKGERRGTVLQGSNPDRSFFLESAVPAPVPSRSAILTYLDLLFISEMCKDSCCCSFNYLSCNKFLLQKGISNDTVVSHF